MRARLPCSILELVAVGPGQSVREARSNTVALSQHAEKRGLTRVWYAELILTLGSPTLEGRLRSLDLFVQGASSSVQAFAAYEVHARSRPSKN
jgi:hypothetical protein